MIRFALFGLAGLPGLYWSALGIVRAFLGRGPGFGPGALLAAWALVLGCALGWVYLPEPDFNFGPDGLLEEPADTTKALLPVAWRGELCSSIVSNQS